MVEPDEEPMDAAKREAAEETGLYDLEFPFGDNYRETVPYAGGKVARYYLAETHEEYVQPSDLGGARPTRASRVALGELR